LCYSCRSAVPRYTLVTFGCQMNQHDSERIGEVLRGAGYAEAPSPESADLVLLNTCSVREKAEQKLRSEVGRLGQLKRARPELMIGVAGCVAQQEGEKLLARMPQIDLIVGPDNIAELPALLRELEGGGPPRVRTEFDVRGPQFLRAAPAADRQNPTAFVTVMKGCNERCSFCIVPHTRGPERYRPSSEIVDEVARLVEAGVREVTLLGQTVNSYRDPEAALPVAPGAGESRFRHTSSARAREDESEFSALLRRIAERVPGLARLRYTSPHPRHLTASLVRAHQDLPVLARHVHMPVQSGSDRLLRRMIRRYTVAEYVERVEALCAAVPGLTLSTDVIVGFPGETREDFDATLALVRRVGFTGLFGFKYSPRPYTPALKLDGEVDEAEKSARLAELFALSEALRAAHLAALVGSTQKVLCEGASQGGGFSGRSEQNEIVHFGAAGDPTGEIVEVRITRAFKNSLEGELADATRRAPRKNGRDVLRVLASEASLDVKRSEASGGPGGLPRRRITVGAGGWDANGHHD
jgi:tRNA-2-methylthio-N6-dimethylallyladenosine synthase